VRHRVNKEQFFRRGRHTGEYSKAGVLGLPRSFFEKRSGPLGFFQS
jgi:hypothetical protein